MKRAQRVLQLGFGAIVLIAIGRTLLSQWEEIAWGSFVLQPGPSLLSLLPLVLFYLLYSISWRRMLSWLGIDLGAYPVHRLLRIYFASMLMRYLPAGKLWNVGSRVELLHRQGESRSLGITSILYEQLYFIGTAVFFFLASLAGGRSFFDLPLPRYAWIGWLALAGCVAVVLFRAPHWALRLAVKIQPAWDAEATGFSLTDRERAEAFLRFLSVNVLQGSAAYLLLRAVIPGGSMAWPEGLAVVAAYPISRFMGQLAAVFPGGIGVREGVFVLLLESTFPTGALLLSAALLRVASILCELLAFLVLSVWQKRANSLDRGREGFSA